MADRSRSLGALASGSRLVGKGSGGHGGHDGYRSDRGGGRYRGRSRRNRGYNPRFQKGRGGGNRDDDRLPRSFDEWKRKLESDGPDAFWDFKACFANTGIPYLETMCLDMFNPGVVAGQRLQAIMMAAIRSMILGRIIHPDGTTGKRLKVDDIEKEMARAEARAEASG